MAKQQKAVDRVKAELALNKAQLLEVQKELERVTKRLRVERQLHEIRNTWYVKQYDAIVKFQRETIHKLLGYDPMSPETIKEHPGEISGEWVRLAK